MTRLNLALLLVLLASSMYLVRVSYDARRLFNDLDRAQNEPDAARRGKPLAEAEQLAMNDAALIPTIFTRTSALVRPIVKNWIPNTRDINRTRWLWIDTKK